MRRGTTPPDPRSPVPDPVPGSGAQDPEIPGSGAEHPGIRGRVHPILPPGAPAWSGGVDEQALEAGAQCSLAVTEGAGRQADPGRLCD